MKITELPLPALIALGLLAAVQLALSVTALIRLLRTPPQRLALGSRWPWLAVILLGQIPGAIVFLAVGRRPEMVPPVTARPASPGGTVATLYPAARGGDPPSGQYAIEITGLTKTYGDKSALDGVDLRVPHGSVFGFLGRNGAGKTTTLRVLLGLAGADGGQARILGRPVPGSPADYRNICRTVGFLPDVPNFYPWLNARETLQLYAGLFDLDRATRDERIEMLLDLAGLTGVGQRVGGYSRGMRQRLGIAQALVNAPQVLLLDEPTSALDPLGRMEILDLIGRLRGHTTVLFSTHILSDVDRVADTAAVIDAGRVLIQAPLGELKSHFATGDAMLVDVGPDRAPLTGALQGRPWLHTVEPAEGTAILLRVHDLGAAQRALPALVADCGLPLVRAERVETTLEDAFVHLLEGAR